jgi:hypothetical protein
MIDAVLAERTRPPATKVSLVWTGPETRASAARDTAVVVRELDEANSLITLRTYYRNHEATIQEAEQRRLAALEAKPQARGSLFPQIGVGGSIETSERDGSGTFLQAVDDDNLPGAFKYVRDTIAKEYGTHDGTKAPIRWEYSQRQTTTKDATKCRVCLHAPFCSISRFNL